MGSGATLPAPGGGGEGVCAYVGLSGTSWHVGGDVSHMHTWRGCGGQAAPHSPGVCKHRCCPDPSQGLGSAFCPSTSVCTNSNRTVRSRRLDTPSSSRRPVPEWEQGVTTTKRQTVFCSLEPSRQRLKGIGPAPAERGLRGPQPHRGRQGQPAGLCRSAGLVRKRVISIRVWFVTWAQLHTSIKTEAEAGQGQIMRGSPSKLGEPRRTWVHF